MKNTDDGSLSEIMAVRLVVPEAGGGGASMAAAAQASQKQLKLKDAEGNPLK